MEWECAEEKGMKIFTFPMITKQALSETIKKAFKCYILEGLVPYVCFTTLWILTTIYVFKALPSFRLFLKYLWDISSNFPLRLANLRLIMTYCKKVFRDASNRIFSKSNICSFKVSLYSAMSHTYCVYPSYQCYKGKKIPLHLQIHTNHSCKHPTAYTRTCFYDWILIF